MAVLYIAVLAVFGWLMISRKLTATLALPLAAICLGVTAVFPQALGHPPMAADGLTALEPGWLAALNTLIQEVLEPGVTRLSLWVMAVILGAVLAAQMKLTGAAERLVRYAAEYAGEDRFRLGLLMLTVIAVLFTTLGGLGAVILVASICLPLLFSLGYEPRIAGGLFLLGLSLGGCLNPVNWAGYQSVLELETATIVPYAVGIALIFFLLAIVFLLKHSGAGSWKRQVVPLAVLLILIIVVGIAIKLLPNLWPALLQVFSWLLLLAFAALTILLILRLGLVAIKSQHDPQRWTGRADNWLTSASVLVPLILLLWSTLQANIVESAPLSIPILTALGTGIFFCALASWTRKQGTVNLTMRALFDGVTSAGPAVVLLIGIGLLLKATMLPQVVASFQPIVDRLPVGNPLGFVLVFLVLSPLALYRGPLNLYGMGYGIMGIFFAAAIMPAALIMAAFFSVGMMQGVCDPTNTHNVWLANFCKVPVLELTRLTVPWVLWIVLGGLVLGTLMF